MRITITGLQAMKKRGERIVMITAYDYSTARLVEDAGIPVVLVGDSLGMVMLGYETTIPVTLAAAAQMLDDALALQDAGIFALVLETVPATLARLISARLAIPTIGIGAGPGCDGQVQVLHDLLGWSSDRVPKHARPYAQIGT